MLKRNQSQVFRIILFAIILADFGRTATADDIVNFQVSSSSASAQFDVDITIGQVFKKGQVAAGSGLIARLSDGTPLNLQVDKKATHGDGSLRHAILSTRIPVLPAYSSRTITLSTGSEDMAPPMPFTDLSDSDVDAEVVLQLPQGRYRASLQELIAAGHSPRMWLAGGVVTEWQFTTPMKSDSGEDHPHLMARFYIRAYEDMERIRIAVILENNWTHVPDPQNIEYDLVIRIAGEERFSRQNVTHFHHARWRKLFWWGEKPEVNVRHDSGYLVASRAVPNYDLGLTVPDSTIEEVYDNWRNGVAPLSGLERSEIMGPGLTYEYFPATGGRYDIGPFPRWAALYLLSMDPRLKEAMIGTAEQAGSFSIHYRDRVSDRPVTITDYPGISSMYNINYMPSCGNCDTPYTTDGAHQPSLAYLPYLVTGDYFFLEELQFWSSANMIDSNPGYREEEKGLVHWRQVRGQAWVLRTLARTAYITPDDDEMKDYFTTLVNNNLDWYNDKFTNNPAANRLGINTTGYAFSYSDSTGIAPWQDDHFTWAIGHIAELGFDKAEPLLLWKSTAPIERMIGEGYCWLEGAVYSLIVRDTKSSPIFDSYADVYEKNFGTATDCPDIGDMGGYAESGHGYPATMQTALAVAVDSGAAGGQEAWEQFMRRTVKPDYSTYPNSAILPRMSDDMPPTNGHGPDLEFSASSEIVDAGSSVTLAWSSPGAISCLASGDWSGSKENTGSEIIAALTDNRRFVLTCFGADGSSTERTIDITVAPESTAGGSDSASGGDDQGDGPGGGGALYWWVVAMLLIFGCRIGIIRSNGSRA